MLSLYATVPSRCDVSVVCNISMFILQLRRRLCVLASKYILGCCFWFHFIYTPTIYASRTILCNKKTKMCNLWLMVYYICLKIIETQTGWWTDGARRDHAIWPRVTRAALNAEIPSVTKISIWHNMVVLWNSHTVKQSRWWFCLIEIRHDSSRGPITLWLCVLHVHWCRDCETFPDQHWNKQGTVSHSQCTPLQCKRISFGIKIESEIQGQSSPELIGILTVLKCICGPDLEILTWIGAE